MKERYQQGMQATEGNIAESPMHRRDFLRFLGKIAATAAAAALPAGSLVEASEIKEKKEPHTLWGMVEAPQMWGQDSSSKFYTLCEKLTTEEMEPPPHPEGREWLAFLQTLSGCDKKNQLEKINTYINKYRYVPDDDNYEKRDYWASPYEFLKSGGDCEDFAIAKYVSLRKLDWPDDMLRIAVVKNMNRDIAHTVLVVYAEGRTWILDNLNTTLVDAESIRHYKPLFAFNMSGCWLYKKNG